MIAAVGSALHMLLLAAVGGSGLPFGVPSAGDDAVLARVAPQECLVYAAWSGSASPSSTSANATEQLLAEPEVQHLIGEVQRLIHDAFDRAAADERGDDDRLMIQLTQTMGGLLITHPTAVFLESFDVRGEAPSVRGGLVCNLGEEVDVAKTFLARMRETIPAELLSEVTVDGVAMHRLSLEGGAPPVTFGIRGAYLIVGVGESAAEDITKRAKGEPPAWLTALVKRLPVERRSIVKYANLKGIMTQASGHPAGEKLAKGIRLLGAENVESLGVVAGLDESQFATRMLLQTEGDPAGLVSILAGEPLTAADLAPIPGDAAVAIAARLDAASALETFRDTVAKVNPDFPALFEAGFGELEEELGIRLRADLIRSLGDVWCVYHSPGEGGLLAGTAAVVKVRDRERAASVFVGLEAVLERSAAGRFGPRFAKEEFRGQSIHYIPAIDDDLLVAPAWCLTEDTLIVALFPQTIRAYLSRGDDYRSIATQPNVAQALAAGDGPTMLVYQDTPKLLELAYPFIQMGGRAIAGELQRDGVDVDEAMLPSMQALRRHLHPGVTTLARADDGLELVSRQSVPLTGAGTLLLAGMGGIAVEPRNLGGVGSVFVPGAVNTTQSMNNLREIVIGMHNHHDQRGDLPAAYNVDKDGKPLLSWRVHLLPYLEQGDLYREFHLDEPWDSEHNKRLIARMPVQYQAPGSKTEEGRTNYLTPRGKGTMFPGKDEEGKISFASVLDGTSNTIMVVEASDEKAVIWTKPDDYEFDPMNPIRGLAGLRGDVILAACADGSVHKLGAEIDAEMFRRLFLRNDGEVVRFERR
jgi:hypothetical protein